MSWNKDKYYKIYKRPLKFDHTQWERNQVFEEDQYRDLLWNRYSYSDTFSWWQRDEWVDFGNPKNMKELNQYRLLTLLHKLSLKQPMITLDRIRWF